MSGSILPSAVAPVRTRKPRSAVNPVTRTQPSQTARDQGLLNRAHGFYLAVFTGLMLAFGGAVTGFLLLGDPWLQRRAWRGRTAATS